MSLFVFQFCFKQHIYCVTVQRLEVWSQSEYCQGHVFFQNLQQGLVAVDPCLQLYYFNICFFQHLGVSICFITVHFKDKALTGLYVADGESLFHLFSIGVKPRPGAWHGLFETT